MSILATTKVLKSIYMSILGFNILLNTSKTLTGHRFQSFYEGAHLYVGIYPVSGRQSTKALISVCLSIFGIFDKGIVTLTAREFRGKLGKPGIRVNQNDRQILTLLTALICPQTMRNVVGNCRQGKGGINDLQRCPSLGGRTLEGR